MAKFKKKSIADYETNDADSAFFASRMARNPGRGAPKPVPQKYRARDPDPFGGSTVVEGVPSVDAGGRQVDAAGDPAFGGMPGYEPGVAGYGRTKKTEPQQQQQTSRDKQTLFGSSFGTSLGDTSMAALRGVGRSVENRALIDFFGDAIEEEQGGFEFEDTIPEMQQTVADIDAGKKKKKAT